MIIEYIWLSNILLKLKRWRKESIFFFNREYKIKVLLSLFNGFKHTEQNNYILEMDGWYSIYNLLRMRKLFNLPFNKSIMLEKYLYEQK